VIVASPECTARNAVTVTGSDDTPVCLQRRTGISTDRSEDEGVFQGKPGPMIASYWTRTTKTVAPIGTRSVVPLVSNRWDGILRGTLRQPACAEALQPESQATPIATKVAAHRGRQCNGIEKVGVITT
jgi:hypothetical protein